MDQQCWGTVSHVWACDWPLWMFFLSLWLSLRAILLDAQVTDGLYGGQEHSIMTSRSS
jgi:hypothetical protein